MAKFEDSIFFNELNRFVGSGGELVLKKSQKEDGDTKIDVGDILIGIGVTHLVESLSRPPGLDSFRSFDVNSLAYDRKMAARAFRVVAKEQTDEGFDFRFEPLSPNEYSEALSEVSEGTVNIDPKTIPDGTVILSFTSEKPEYTLKSNESSPRANWEALAKGERHWNVGIGSEDDFWAASFPSDEMEFLKEFSAAAKLGRIRFGLSMLKGSVGAIKLEKVETEHPTGRITKHDFCLNGNAAGTKNLDSPFPIGLRTEITFFPVE